MKKIIEISAAPPTQNFDRSIDFMGNKFEISRLGTNFNIPLMEELADRYDGKVDGICFSGLPQPFAVKGLDFTHQSLSAVKSRVKHSMVADGSLFKDLYIPWVIKKYAIENPSLLKNKRVCFYMGALQKTLIHFFEEFSSSVVLADPYFSLKIPAVLKRSSDLDLFLKMIHPFIIRKKIGHKSKVDFSSNAIGSKKGLRKINECDVFVAYSAQIELMDLNHLKGKTFITDYLTPQTEIKLKEAGVENIIACSLDLVGLNDISFPMAECLFQSLKKDYSPISQDDVFEWIEKYDLTPKIKTFKTNINDDNSFAFIVHPLKSTDLFRHPKLKMISPLLEKMDSFIEKATTVVPGFFYGSIKGIKSSYNGREVQGSIYSVAETPKMLLKSRPEKIYKKLIKLSEMAHQENCKIIGLGAYTKIVGDAGLTVAKKSPIPVTTGNSLSSASTLWAAAIAVEKMGFVKKIDGTYQGQVMVVGATGSIGKVTAKLLAQSWSELVLVAPRGYKLLELTEEIKNIAPHCRVIISTVPDHHISKCDLIITTTSAQGKKILDIMKVRPGAVICDVSRPFDISEEDATKRPDVIVMASGEVELPGKVELTCDIGLPGNVVYACLAETAILSMEGRFENFTLSRNLSYDKVREIDRLARKHGVRLSAIMGHSIEITDEEMFLTRKYALQEREKTAVNNYENFQTREAKNKMRLQ